MAVNEIRFTERQVESLVTTSKRPAWEFAIDIEGAPPELDLLARDLSYEPFGITLEEKNYGSQQVSLPVNNERLSLTITLRDTKDKKLYTWCKQKASEIIHSDGTFGLPAEYVKQVVIYSTSDKTADPDPDVFYMIFTAIGAINPDRSARGQFLEFPITMTQYKTTGYNSRNRIFSSSLTNTINTL